MCILVKMRAPRIRGSFDAVILAGGMSTRMGTDKATLAVSPGSPTLIEWIAYRLQKIAASVVVVSSRPNTPLPANVKLIPDAVPGVGALGGVYSGLRAASTGTAFVIATDMPFVSLRVVLYMARLARHFDALVPLLDGRMEPLHAFYRASCLPAVERAIARGDRRIISFFDEVRVGHPDPQVLRRLDPRGMSFLNVNTPDEWSSVAQELRRRIRRYWRPAP
jgi:molybdopterin-guanine dinucleotide biosynthesis protein A